jgi:hypothetical protein
MDSLTIFRNALVAAKGDYLKAAENILHTMQTYPDTRTDACIEAVRALIRECRCEGIILRPHR